MLSIMEAEEKLEEDIRGLLEIRENVASVIARVYDDLGQSILEMYYLAFLPWEEIGRRLKNTVRLLYWHRDKAMKEVQNILDRSRIS